MGEIADMMVEGVMCEQCGVWLEGADKDEAPGYPRCCTLCANEPEIAEMYKDRIADEL